MLENSCLNRVQIRKTVTFQIITKNQISVKVDLHGLNLEETKDIIQRLFATKKLHITEIEIVHGYKRGTVLKDYIEKDFKHSRLDKGRNRICNEGATKLYLKPWSEVLKQENKPKIKFRKSDNKPNSHIEQSEEAVVNDALFQLAMIKEKVKEARISGEITHEAYDNILNQEQLEYIKPLLEISLTKEEFLFRILNLYVYQDTMYVDVGFNKMQLTEVTKLVNKLLSLQSENQIIMMLRHKNKRDGVIKDYIKNTFNDEMLFEMKINEDNTLTTIKKK